VGDAPRSEVSSFADVARGERRHGRERVEQPVDRVTEERNRTEGEAASRLHEKSDEVDPATSAGFRLLSVDPCVCPPGS